ncbi:MAG: TonB-dependent receptor [Muribaculaceae bacterium]|nr:TonB-dependent receptor [Muribaculaceae bacterium]
MKQRKTLPSFSSILKIAVFACLGFAISIPQAFAEPAPAAAPQQATAISGTVEDPDGEPLIGATILVKGSTTGTATDIDGNFTINAAPGQELIISYVGYKSLTVKVPIGETNLGKIILSSDSQLLDDVVVIGYGTARKGDLTSAVASIKSEDFSQGKIGDAADLIKGKVAGLTIIKSSGAPGATSEIRLRGITSAGYGSTQPLILVDGIEGDMNTVAPENIASIDVLKDASAAAIYGTRGANGVILITTKSGQRADTSYFTATYSDYFSWSDWSKKAKFMDTTDVLYGRTAQSYMGYDTDWLKAITRKTGFTQNHAFQISGGSKSATYAASLAYNKELGIIKNTDNENFRMQMDYTQYLWNDILRFNFNVLTTRQKYSAANGNAAYAYRQAIIHNPSEPVYNPDGSYYEDFSQYQYYNPLEILNEVTGSTTNRFIQTVGNVTVEPIKGWQTKLLLSWSENRSLSESFTSPDYYTLAQQTDYNGYAYKGEGSYISKNLEVTTKYFKNFGGKHRFDALLGYSYIENESEGFSAGNGNFSTLAYLWNNLGNGSFLTEEDRHASMSSSREMDKLISFFGRISYGFDERYNILASVRHEGSTQFGKNNKWATFPSVSVGWNIMNEEFMSPAGSWLDNLRLRVGFGVTGITPNQNYISQYLYNYAGWGDILSPEGEWIKTLEVTQNYNPNLKWQTTKEWNFGVDFGFLNNRLRGNVDFYIKTTDDLLYDYVVPVPPNMYSMTTYNVGSIRNIGVELAITGVPIETKDFYWSSTLTLAHNKDKLLKLSSDLYETDNFQEMGGISDPISVATHCMEVGSSFGDFWGLKFRGYDKDGFALVEARDDDGNWVLKPFNANLNTESNRQRLGSGAPKVILGWGNTLRWKNFDLSLQFTGQFGYKILNTMRAFYENNSIAYNRLKSAQNWYHAIDREGNPLYNADGSALMVQKSNSMGQGFWSEFLEPGDFFKLQNVTLGYTIPFKGKITNFIKDLRVYFSANNLFYITKYSGIDPEVSNWFMAPGIDDRDKYPTTRTYTCGLSFEF